MPPPPPIPLLQSLHLLPSLLPLSALTVILLSTSYTHETPFARQNLQSAASSINCPSIAYYQVDLHIRDLDTLPPKISAVASVWPWQSEGSRHRHAVLAHNLTRGIPWFPCIRLIKGGEVITYMGGYDVGSIARMLAENCGGKVEKVEGIKSSPVKGRFVTSNSAIGESILNWVDAWKDWKPIFYEQSLVGMEGWVEGEYGKLGKRSLKLAYLVVCERWCGKCQRIVDVVEEMEGLWNEGYVAMVWGVTEVGERLGGLVEGVPTVMEIRELEGGKVHVAEFLESLEDLKGTVRKWERR